MSRRLIALALAATYMLASPALAEDFAITNARVATGDGSDPIDNATVVVRGGKVVAAGRGVAVPAGVRVIDGSGKWVTPGIVAAGATLGLWDVEGVRDSNDISAGKSPFSAAIDVSYVVNPASVPLQVSRAAGVTRAAIAPGAGNEIFAGQGAVIDLGADGDPVTVARAFQYVEMGEQGGALAGGSRAAAHVALRNALGEARELVNNPNAARRDDAMLTRADAQALAAVIAGRQPLFFHVERVADIRATLKLKQEFPALRLVIVGADEGWMIAREIAAAGVPVIASPLTDLPTSFESLASTQSNVGRMAAAGVKVAIGNMTDGIMPRNAVQYAGNMVGLTRVPGASGLSWGKALAAITSVPAEILGQGGKFGTLRPGAAGDVVLWDGDPLEVSSGVLAVWIDGEAQNLVNHQTRLRDRYRQPQEGALPKAYDW